MTSRSSSQTHSLRPGLRPLIILGAPRSGTKLLRNLLSQSTHCAVIPYGINHVWRLGLSYDAPDSRPASEASPKRVRQIRSQLLNLAEAHHTPASGYLVEKTCANTLRVPFVNRVLPDARFIHILRDGRDAAVSAREKWDRPPALGDAFKKLFYVSFRCPSSSLKYLYNLWRGLRHNGQVHYQGPRHNGIQGDAAEHSLLILYAHQWKACVSESLNELSQLPEDRVTTIRYKSLVTDRSVLESVIKTFDLTSAESALGLYDDIVHDHSVGRWRRELSPSDQQKLTTILQPVLDRLNFSHSP